MINPMSKYLIENFLESKQRRIEAVRNDSSFEEKERSMFETHKLNDNGFKEVKEFKTEMSKSLNKVLSMMPEGREKAIFKTKVEEAMFFGTKAISSKDGNYIEVFEYN